MTQRGGFSLVEGLVAITLMGVVVTALAPLLFLGAHEGTMTGSDAERNAAMLASVDEFTALSTDEVEARVAIGATVCDTISAGGLDHERCVSNAQGDGSRQMELKIVLTPIDGGSDADSVTFTRTKAAAGSPFN